MKEICVYFNDSLCVCWCSVLTGHKIFTGYTIKNSTGATFTPVTLCFLLPIWKFDIQRMFVQKGEALKKILKNTKRYHYTLKSMLRISCGLEMLANHGFSVERGGFRVRAVWWNDCKLNNNSTSVKSMVFAKAVQIHISTQFSKTHCIE